VKSKIKNKKKITKKVETARQMGKIKKILPQVNSEEFQRGKKINPFDKLRINAERSRSIKIMTTKDILEKAKKELADLTGFKSPSAIGFKKEGAELIAIIEVIEKESIPDGMDILGTYEVRVEQDGKIIGYERTDLRKRVDTTLNKET